nr:hypothetical protein [Tanacetum cinerariifolium]
MNQNFYNSNSSGFDQFQPSQYSVVYQPPQEETSVKILHDQENVINSVQPFLRKFNRCSFFETPKVLLLAWDRVSEIKDAFRNKQYKPEDIKELFRKLFNDVQNIHEELAKYINTPSWNRPVFYNNDEDDDEEFSIPMSEMYKSSLTAMTPITDSLIMEDEHLDTISETESDKLIKSSVENLVPNLSLSEDLFDIESECDVPVCGDFMTFSNLLIDADDSFSSSDDESFFDEDVPKEIYSNPLFDEEISSINIDPHHFNAESDLIESLLNQDSLIISSPKIDSLLEEFFEEFNSKNSDAIIESFSPSPILVEDSDSLMEEIDLFLTPDDSMPPGIKIDDYDFKGDILFLEEFLSNDSPSLLENESFHFDFPSSPRPPAKPPNDGIYYDDEPDTGLLTAKGVGDIFEHCVLMPRLLRTQPALCPVIDTLLPFSSKNVEN